MFSNYGEIQGVHYIGGNYKVPQHLTDIPQCVDRDDPKYGHRGNPALLLIAEGSKHLSVGNEAYGFEDNGHVARCLNKRGWISKWDQPSRVVQNAKGEDVTITAPPMVAILKSAPPHFYE